MKYCPLFSIADTRFTGCLEEECAWYIDAEKRCCACPSPAMVALNAAAMRGFEDLRDEAKEAIREVPSTEITAEKGLRARDYIAGRVEAMPDQPEVPAEIHDVVSDLLGGVIPEEKAE